MIIMDDRYFLQNVQRFNRSDFIKIYLNCLNGVGLLLNLIIA